MTFKALLARKTNHQVSTELVDFDEADLMDGDVLVQVEYSTLNYKDALALTGKSPVIRTFPLIPGIDLAGVVLESSRTDFKPGDRVVLNGWDLSMGHHGGLAQRARVRGEWLNRIAWWPLPGARSMPSICATWVRAKSPTARSFRNRATGR